MIIKAASVAALIIPFVLMGSHSCSDRNDLKSVELIYNYPISFFKEKDEIKIYSLKDTIIIFYYDGYTLYRLSPTVEFTTGKKIKGTEPYFIFEKKNKYGYLFSSLKDTSKGAKFPVDSFLNNRGMKGKDFDTPPDSLWSLIAAIKDGREECLFEKYAPIKPADETNFDSIYYYYTKKLSTEFSFSKKLDSLKGMKLYKIRLIYNEKFSLLTNTKLPQREFLFEIRNNNVSNPKEIIRFIKRFENCCNHY